MPAAIKLQEEYGDALQVIFVESQNSGFEKSIGMATQSGWLGNQAIWTNQYLFSAGGNGLPAFALLDGEGKVVLKGSSSSMHGQIKDSIAEMVKTRGGAPADVPSSVAKVYSTLEKGSYAKAIDIAQKLIAKPGSKDTQVILAAAEASLVAAEAKFAGQLARADWLLANGFPMRAQVIAEGLVKGAKGNDDLFGRATGLKSKLESEDLKAEFTAAKALAKLESSLYENGGSSKLVSQLNKLANENAGTPIAKRAKKLVEVAQYSQL
ncbi:MAG: hypothetical protein O3A95_02145 [Planctomycetota bacterium]|nr:hypothetical protein [Planctomycetota bacterium]MDA1113084.1 hypothetical protein [Planctomycetota bacterium]